MVTVGWASVVSVLLAAASDEPLRTVPLRYDPALVKADFPSPAARLTVNGRSGWFLVDTGAGVHMVTSWFAEAAGLEPDPTSDGRSAASTRPVERWPFEACARSWADLEDGRALTLAVAVVTDFPAEFEQHQIAASSRRSCWPAPARPWRSTCGSRSFASSRSAEAVRRLGARILPRDRVQVCGSTKDEVPNLVFAIDVAGGGGTGRLVLDTGAAVTKVVARSALLKASGSRPVARRPASPANRRRTASHPAWRSLSRATT